MNYWRAFHIKTFFKTEAIPILSLLNITSDKAFLKTEEAKSGRASSGKGKIMWNELLLLGSPKNNRVLIKPLEMLW